MKYKEFYKYIILIVGVLIANYANAVTVNFPITGGTGVSSTSAGSLGLCLRVTSTSPLLYDFGSCSSVNTATSGLFSINALSAADQFLVASSTGSTFAITSSGDTHTFFVPNAGTATRGFVSTTTQTLAGAKTFQDAATFSNNLSLTGGFFDASSASGTNGMVLTSTGLATQWRPISSIAPSSIVQGTGISVSAATGTVTITNTGVQTVTAGTGISVSVATGTPTITNTGVTALALTSPLQITGSTGSLTGNLAGLSSSGTPFYFPQVNTGGSAWQYAQLVAGTNISITYSGASTTINATAGGSGLSSLNGLTTSSQLFATSSSNGDFAIISSGDTHTFQLPDAGASARGLVTTGAQTLAGHKTLSATTTHSSSLVLSGALFAGSSSGTLDQILKSTGSGVSWTNLSALGVSAITQGTGISVSSATGSVAITNTGLQTLTAGTGISVSTATGTPTITNTGVTALALTSPLQITGSTGSLTGNLAGLSSSGTPYYFPQVNSAGSAWQYAQLVSGGGLSVTSSGASTTITLTAFQKHHCSWNIENPTSTEDSVICVVNNTSTINKIYSGNRVGGGNTVTFNIVFDTSAATATTSASKAFSVWQTVTATSTPSSTTTFASSTVGAGSVLRFSTTAASSSQFYLDIWMTENQL